MATAPKQSRSHADVCVRRVDLICHQPPLNRGSDGVVGAREAVNRPPLSSLGPWSTDEDHC